MMTLGALRDREKKTAGDLTVSKHIITVLAWKTANGPDLTERKKKHRLGEQRGKRIKIKDKGKERS